MPAGLNSINPDFQTGYKTPHESKHAEKYDDARMRASSAAEARPAFATNYGKRTMPGKAG